MPAINQTTKSHPCVQGWPFVVNGKHYIFVVSFIFFLIFTLPFFFLILVFAVSVVAFTGIEAEAVPKQIAAKAIIQSAFFMVFLAYGFYNSKDN